MPACILPSEATSSYQRERNKVRSFSKASQSVGHLPADLIMAITCPFAERRLFCWHYKEYLNVSVWHLRTAENSDEAAVLEQLQVLVQA